MTTVDMRESDFFIVGTPKCGMSALAGHLREDPDCFMCWPKALGCPEPKRLQYRRVALLGAPVRPLLGAMPSEPVHIVVFDDLAQDPRAEYLRLLAFLRFRCDGRVDYPAVNARRTHPLRLVSRLTQRPLRSAIEASKALKRRFGLERTGVLDRLRRANRTRASRLGLPGELWRKMADTFAEDVALLSSLLERDFSSWLAGESVSGPLHRSKTQEI